MEIPAYTDPGSWQIALEATDATLSMSTARGPRTLYRTSEISGAFYLRPDGSLAGFSLELPFPRRWGEPVSLSWEAADLDTDESVSLRLGENETRADVSVLSVVIPGEPAYVKIVLETAFSPRSLRLPGLGLHRARPVTLRLFSEIRPAA